MNPASCTARRGRVLICEDDPVQALALEKRLDELGFVVAGPVSSVEEAMAMIRTGKLNAALLDVSLRDGSVSVAAAELEAGSVPFAFITGYGPETAPTLSSYPNHLVVPKPVSSALLEEILSSLLQGQPQEEILSL